MTPTAGKLELLPDAVRLIASDGDGTQVEVPYGELAAVWLEEATLVLEKRDGETIRIRSDAQPRILFEIARRLAQYLHPARAGRSFAIVVPLKPGAREVAQGLVEGGPPFDPEESRLRRHQVFLTDSEAVFVFESPEDALEDLLADPSTLTAAAAWRECVGGLARIAEEAYSWESPRAARVEGVRAGRE